MVKVIFPYHKVLLLKVRISDLVSLSHRSHIGLGVKKTVFGVAQTSPLSFKHKLES